MNKFSILSILLTGAVIFSGCSNSSSDDNKAPQVTVIGKPLPVDCADQSQLTLSWPSDKKAYRYSVAQGFQNGIFDITDSFTELEANAGVTVSLDRGVHTYFQAIKETVDGGSYYEFFDFYVPTCKERAGWREKHPEYEEPTVLVLDWI